MACFYADAQFPIETTLALRSLGHDVLTINRYDFIRLHKTSTSHAGIIACTKNTNFERLAEKIHQAVAQLNSLDNQLIRVYRDA